MCIVYSVIFGYISLSIIEFVCTKLKKVGEPVNSIYTDCLRCLRVHHLEYWHPA